MNRTVVNIMWAVLLLCAIPVDGQIRHPRHPRYPLSPYNDPQLQIPTDQAQSCLVPLGERSMYEQYQTFDSHDQPASRGYLCIAVPAGRTFIIDHLFVEADYDRAPEGQLEWYLDTIAGNNEALLPFVPVRAGSVSPHPHYLLSQGVHLPVDGGTRVTLIMHNYAVGPNSWIEETPGTASFGVVGHWE